MPSGPTLQSLATLSARLLAILIAVAVLVTTAGFNSEDSGLSWFFFIRQDIAAIAIILIALFFMQRPTNLRLPRHDWVDRLGSIPHLHWACAIIICLCCWAGHYLIFQGYDLSRDEQLANFDAYILSHGRLFWPLPPEWHGDNAAALNQMFMLPIGEHEAWVSNYLPGNASLRALVGMFADPALTSPFLAGIGAITLFDIARRLWPENRENALLALLLYATSSQILITAMTAYAMTAHLTFNLIWLALFMRDNRAAHACALAIGFIATGLHQPIFHPMFVAPFLLMLLMQRRWQLLAFYCAGYTLIGLFWLAWPLWLATHAVQQAHPDAGGGIGFWTRIVHIISIPSIGGIWLMVLNNIRLLAWQHIMFLPLLIAGLSYCWRVQDRFARALALGLLVPLPVIFILLPYQGHGWGYRYLHGLLGNAFLLCIYGWHRLSTNSQLREPMTLATLATAMIIIPLHGWQAWKMTAPYAQIDRAISESGAQWAIIDESAVPFASDLVANMPDLSNRPLRVLAGAVLPSKLEHVCQNDVIIVGQDELRPITSYFGTGDESNKQPATDGYCDTGINTRP